MINRTKTNTTQSIAALIAIPFERFFILGGPRGFWVKKLQNLHSINEPIG
jgi:hypothetical protein